MKSIKKFNLNDGTFIRYTEQGSGQPLLLMHTIRNRLEYSDQLLPYLTKKFKVYVKNPKGNVVKVNFGQGGGAKGGTMRIRKSNPKARKSFRARHNCANPGPKTKARYWSCKAW